MPRLTAPPRALRLVLIAGVLPALAFGLAACDSGGGMDDDPPPTTDSVTVSAEAVTDDGSRIDSAAIAFDGTEAGTGYAEKTYEKDAGQSVSVSASEDDYVNTETSIDLGADQNVSLKMLEELPETVTVPVENVAADGDSLITGTVTWDDSVVAEDVVSADVEIPASRNAGELCVQESDLFNEGCKTLTPTSDISQVQEIAVQRKTVELTVIPDPPYGESGETDVTVYEPFMADSVKFTGENTVELAKRKDEMVRQVATDLITDDPEKMDHDHDHLDRLVADTSVTAHSDVGLTAQPTLLPACSDNMNSIPQDPFEKDRNDPGCAQDDGFGYDPDDDNEIHGLFSRTTGHYFDDSTFVPSTAGERTGLITSANSPLPQSVTVAVGEIFFGIEIKPLGGGFAIHIKSGDDNDNLTVEKTSDVVNPDSTNSWGATEVYGIDRTFFADGPHYAVYAWDSTKANGEPPFDSDKLVIFYEGLQNARGHIIEYYYEPDHPDLQDGSSSAKTAGLSQSDFATLENGECVNISGGTACMNGVPDDF
jgi:hypothetical protein